MKKVDPLLIRQLQDAERDNAPVQAVLSVINPDKLPLPSAEEIKRKVERLISETSGRMHEQPQHYRLFAHLGTFAVEATPKFLRALMSLDDVLFAVANKRPGLFEGDSD
jgi:hypothetical protein